MDDQQLKKAIVEISDSGIEMNEWESGFVDSCRKWMDKDFRSDKQRAVARKIYEAYGNGQPGGTVEAPPAVQPSQQTPAPAPVVQPPAPTGRQQLVTGKDIPLIGKDVIPIVAKVSTEVGKMLSPKGINAQRFLQCCFTALASLDQRKLERTTARSVVEAVYDLASLGLEPNSPMQHCWLIPYGSGALSKMSTSGEVYEVRVQLGYRGILDLVRRSGAVANIYPCVVHEGDKFQVYLGTDKRIEHEPGGCDDVEKITHVYAVVKNLHGEIDFEVMSRAAIEHIRVNFSKNGNFWRDHWEEMAKKTVLRKLCKRLPMDAAMRKAEELDNENWKTAEDAEFKPLREEGENFFDKPTEKITSPAELSNVYLDLEMQAQDPECPIDAAKENIEASYASKAITSEERTELLALAFNRATREEAPF